MDFKTPGSTVWCFVGGTPIMQDSPNCKLMDDALSLCLGTRPMRASGDVVHEPQTELERTRTMPVPRL